jgi:large subunit ribosomal protein L29
MKMKEITEKTSEELKTRLLDLKKNIFSLKFKKATGQLENNMVIRNLKKDVARIETVLSQRAISENNQGS